MAMSKAKVIEAKTTLINRLGILCKMTREELTAELPKVCGFKPAENTTEPDLIYVLMKFAIMTALPNS